MPFNSTQKFNYKGFLKGNNHKVYNNWAVRYLLLYNRKKKKKNLINIMAAQP